MLSFGKSMEDRQVNWRRSNISSAEMGTWRNDPYPWIVPERLWEEGLWEGIRSGSDNPLSEYLRKDNVQKHIASNNLKSSWVMCANLYFPFRSSKRDRDLLASFLRCHADPQIESLDEIQLEYCEGGELHPSRLLGETGGRRGAGQTSPDLGLLVNGGRGLVLVESKFTESDFSRCSARKRDGTEVRPGNPDPDRCNRASAVAENPSEQCHQSVWGRRYWEHLAPAVDRSALESLPWCPAAKRGYQLFRQTALAEGIAQSGKYELTVSAVAVDERNTELNTSLRRSGVPELRRWRQLFRGRAHFAVFTHQQWVDWVRGHADNGRWDEWISWIGARYAI